MSKQASRRNPIDRSSSLEMGMDTVGVLTPPAPDDDFKHSSAQLAPAPRKIRSTQAVATAKRFTATHSEEDGGNRQAELFYLQKQIQLQTPMVFILEDGSKIQGIVEWYDRHSIKVRGKLRMLIYKSAIKYLYKAGEVGATPQK